MGKPTAVILIYMVLAVLTASAQKGCKIKKACKNLNGSCISRDAVCDGVAIQHKGFCKGKCTCCVTVEDKQCPVNPPPGPEPAKYKNLTPVIGILAQDVTEEMKEILPQYKEYIAASYVKWIESGGAKVVPILTDQDDAYYDEMVDNLNGFVFPGGGATIWSSTAYGRTGRKLYDRIVKSGLEGNPVPLWATCLGFQMVMYLEANPTKRKKVLSECEGTWYTALPLNLTENGASSRLLRSAPDSIKGPLVNMDITHNVHKKGVTPETFDDCDIGRNYNIISTNKDTKGMTFISTVEHKTLPIWGAQWHIEKNSYEWYSWQHIPQIPEAIHQQAYFAQFFVDQARQNTNKFSDPAKLRDIVIYNHAPINMDDYRYGQDKFKSSWIQAYYFE